ncbi:MAG: hypothetical protein EOO40_04980 [Deltaproteobacteria bacterium]|nr:MAG: hypothetical protein EOO40_04980 [Deltaproteobacteria bacterium]
MKHLDWVVVVLWLGWACAATYGIMQQRQLTMDVRRELQLLRDAVLRNTHAHITTQHRSYACAHEAPPHPRPQGMKQMASAHLRLL